jgi:hypothetical protein
VQSKELTHAVTALQVPAMHSLVAGVGQSAAVAQATHKPVATSHTLPLLDVAQSALTRHGGVVQTPEMQTVPLPQSTASKHCTHFCAVLSHSIPALLQSTSELQVRLGSVDGVEVVPAPLPAEPPSVGTAVVEAVVSPPDAPTVPPVAAPPTASLDVEVEIEDLPPVPLVLFFGSSSSHADINNTSVLTAVSKVMFNEHPLRRVMALLLSASGAPHSLASAALYAGLASRQHFLPTPERSLPHLAWAARVGLQHRPVARRL